MIDPSDIVYLLSGGAGNTDPTASLGGDPSSHQIQTGLDNLFDDASEEQVQDGLTDYRCFYIFNNNATDPFLNTTLWIDSTVSGSGTITLGINLVNEVQQIVVQGTVTGGFLDVIYEGNTVQWDWDASLSTWAINLQNALNSITSPALTGCIVTVSQLGSVYTFQIEFAGEDSNRFQPLLTHGSISTLFGATSATISKIQSGSPINSIAATIDVDTTPPFGIDFAQYGPSNPIDVGNLRGTDGFPVWVQRSLPAGSSALADAGFNIRYKGSPF